MVARSLLVSSLLLLLGPAQATPPDERAWGRWTCRPDAGVVCPQLATAVRPSYPLKALQAMIEGTVRLECLVTDQGRCSDIKVIRGLDPKDGLNDAAVAALKDWRFLPGTKDHTPIPVPIAVELTFALGPPVATTDDPVYKSRDEGVKPPVLIKEIKPTYPRAAMDAKIHGSVWLACIVEPTGVCSAITVVHSLDNQLGLDQAAITALTQWRFLPGRKDGQPVRVRVTVEMTFKLR